MGKKSRGRVMMAVPPSFKKKVKIHAAKEDKTMMSFLRDISKENEELRKDTKERLRRVDDFFNF